MGGHRPDERSYHILLVLLGLVVLGAMVGIVALAILGKDIHPVLPALAGTALGWLTGLFAQPPSSGSGGSVRSA